MTGFEQLYNYAVYLFGEKALTKSDYAFGIYDAADNSLYYVIEGKSSNTFTTVGGGSNGARCENRNLQSVRRSLRKIAALEGLDSTTEE